MWIGRVDAGGRGELMVRGRARPIEHDPVIAVVAGEPGDLGQAEALTAERHNRLQLPGLPGEVYLETAGVETVGRRR